MNTLAVSLLICGSLVLLSAADARRFVRAADDPSDDNGGRVLDMAPGYVDADLLRQLLTSSRSKRQWCHRGMTFNHVIGRCMMSFAAMRARGY